MKPSILTAITLSLGLAACGGDADEQATGAYESRYAGLPQQTTLITNATVLTGTGERLDNAEVWAEHSVWPQDPGFTTALAGGVTMLQILPARPT